MNLKKIILPLLLLFPLVALADKPVQTTFSVQPQMHCANCEKKIKTSLRFEKGVKEIATSIPDQQVRITYDPAKSTPATLVHAFKKIGYTATPLPTTSTDTPAKSPAKK